MIGGKFISDERTEVKKSDPIAASRTLIRHDANAVAQALMRLYFT